MHLRVGDCIMYVPSEISEQAGMIPRMARIGRIRHEGARIFVETNQGVMIFTHEHEKVQVVV